MSWTCIEKLDTEWCGQHPDFWEVETEAEPDVTNCESPALEEIARLLNDGEHAEALKEFRRMHGLIDQFVCTNCGNISSSTGPGFACRECGGELTARVVITQTDSNPPTLDDVLAAYRRAADMAGMYSGRICDACARPHTVVCGRCLVGWQLLYKPKEDAQ